MFLCQTVSLLTFNNKYFNMSKKCCVPNCDQSRNSIRDLTMHQFPSNNETVKILTATGYETVNRLQAWLEKVKPCRPFHNSMRVCGLHFDKFDFFHGKTKRSLKKNAIPSKNLPEVKHVEKVFPTYIVRLKNVNKLKADEIKLKQTQIDHNNATISTPKDNPQTTRVNHDVEDPLSLTSITTNITVKQDMCRTCLDPISSGEGRCVFMTNVPNIIKILTNIEVFEGDRFSSKICDKCYLRLQDVLDLKKQIELSYLKGASSLRKEQMNQEINHPVIKEEVVDVDDFMLDAKEEEVVIENNNISLNEGPTFQQIYEKSIPKTVKSFHSKLKYEPQIKHVHRIKVELEENFNEETDSAEEDSMVCDTQKDCIKIRDVEDNGEEFRDADDFVIVRSSLEMHTYAKPPINIVETDDPVIGADFQQHILVEISNKNHSRKKPLRCNQCHSNGITRFANYFCPMCTKRGRKQPVLCSSLCFQQYHSKYYKNDNY